MAKTKTIPLGYFNEFMPNLLSDSEVQFLFFARKPLFERLVQRIAQEHKGSIPQHYLMIGKRGMGKTLLLLRLSIELKSSEYRHRFVGLSFSEEQYTLHSLSKLWLNALESLADVLDSENNHLALTTLEIEISEIKGIKDEKQRCQEAYRLLKKFGTDSNRRPVLLLDNLNQIFDSLSTVEHSQLRQLITEADAPILIGASPNIFNDDYQAPFYDAFDIEYLEKLSFEQSLALIEHLGEVTGQINLKSIIYQNLARLETLHQLTGGNIRTLVTLFELITKDFSDVNVYRDLEMLVNRATPLYKAQFEDLAKQSQVILGSIAQNWNPCNLDTLRQLTNLESGTISAHLDRLQKAGWIQRLGPRKNATYEVSERFFNIWYLMRTSTQRQGRELRWLTDFLQGWFDKKELHQIFKNQLTDLDRLGENDLAYYLPMSRSLGKGKRAEAIKEQFYKRLIEIFDGDEQKVTDCMGVKPEELNDQWFIEHKIEKKQRLELEAEVKFGEAVKADESGQYEKAIDLFNEALPHYKNPSRIWNYIGSILMDNLGNIEEAEKAYRKAIEIDKKNSYPYSGLGNILSLTNRMKEAEEVYKKSIEIDENSIYALTGLGNIFMDFKREYKKAEELYLKSISVNENYIYPKANLVFLYRDKLQDFTNARLLFEQTKSYYEKLSRESIQDTAYLHEATFALYDKNWGIAAGFWQQAFNLINEKLPHHTQDDWQRSAAVAVRLGYGQDLLELMEKTGHDRKFRPFYEAIKALTLNSEDYLRTQVAAEVREVALVMYAFMKKYNT